jgi:hypothetical protein
MSQETAMAQLEWARQQDAMNRETLNRVLGVQLPAMEEQYANAREDRARYENTFRPAEDQLIADFQSYNTPERRAEEQGRAVADVSAQFDAQRRNALQRLEGYGVDPSQTRNAALDVGVRTQQAAAQAQASTNAGRRVEDTGRALRADVINIGRGMPSQVAQSYGQSVAAGQAGVGGANQTFGTSAGAMGTPGQWMGGALQGYGQGANIMSQGYQNQMAGYNAGQAGMSNMMGGIGGIAGMAMGIKDGGKIAKEMSAGMGIPFDGAGPVAQGPTDGSGVDDQVPAQLSVGEFVIPADVVQKKGVEFFEKLLEKYHTPAAMQGA